MKQVTIVRRAPVKNQTLPISYSLEIEVTASQDITKAVFVKERIQRMDGTLVDRFAAVATPTHLLELDEVPSNTSVYYRASKINLTAQNEAYLEDLWKIITSEIQLLLENAESLETIDSQATYNITSSGMSIVS